MLRGWTLNLNFHTMARSELALGENQQLAKNDRSEELLKLFTSYCQQYAERSGEWETVLTNARAWHNKTLRLGTVGADSDIFMVAMRSVCDALTTCDISISVEHVWSCRSHAQQIESLTGRDTERYMLDDQRHFRQGFCLGYDFQRSEIAKFWIPVKDLEVDARWSKTVAKEFQCSREAGTPHRRNSAWTPHALGSADDEAQRYDLARIREALDIFLPSNPVVGVVSMFDADAIDEYPTSVVEIPASCWAGCFAPDARYAPPRAPFEFEVEFAFNQHSAGEHSGTSDDGKQYGSVACLPIALEFGTAALLQESSFAEDVKNGELPWACIERGNFHMRILTQYMLRTLGIHDHTDAGTFGTLAGIPDLVETMTGRSMWNNKGPENCPAELSNLDRIKCLLQHTCVRFVGDQNVKLKKGFEAIFADSELARAPGSRMFYVVDVDGKCSTIVPMGSVIETNQG